MFCGFEYYRLNQHWFFHKFLEKDPMKTYAKQIGIPRKFTNKHKGAWFIDFTQKPNYTTLTNKQQELLDEQVNNMIDSKYTFYHMDGLNKARLEKMVEDEAFNDSILVIDEVHNLSNAMSKDNPGVRGKNLQKCPRKNQRHSFAILCCHTI